MIEKELTIDELPWLEQSLKTPYYVGANLLATTLFSRPICKENYGVSADATLWRYSKRQIAEGRSGEEVGGVG